MTPDPVVLRPDDRLAVAIHKMAVGGFRHIPVVDASGRPIGVVVGGGRVPPHRQRARVSGGAPADRAAGRGPRRRPDLGDAPGRRRPRAGGEPVAVRTAATLDGALWRRSAAASSTSRHAPTTGSRPSASRPRAGVPVIAVGQHDDADAPSRGAGGRGVARVRLSGAVRARRPRARRLDARRSSPRRPSTHEPTAASPPSATRSGWPPPPRGGRAAGLDALLIGVGADLRYLAGLRGACRSSG